MSCNLENSVNSASQYINEAIEMLKIDGQPLPTTDWIKVKTAMFLLKDAAYLLERLMAESDFQPPA
jgi:hypothetical protein